MLTSNDNKSLKEMDEWLTLRRKVSFWRCSGIVEDIFHPGELFSDIDFPKKVSIKVLSCTSLVSPIHQINQMGT